MRIDNSVIKTALRVLEMLGAKYVVRLKRTTYSNVGEKITKKRTSKAEKNHAPDGFFSEVVGPVLNAMKVGDSELIFHPKCSVSRLQRAVAAGAHKRWGPKSYTTKRCGNKVLVGRLK